MALYGDNYLFLHYPKTGGIYISSILRHNDAQEIGSVHDGFPELYNYADKEFFNKFTFVFIRHPILWYRSRWLFRLSISGWELDHEMDYNCASNDFNDFIERVHHHYPNGWFEIEQQYYLEHTPKLDYIGRQEFLKSDLETILNILGLKKHSESKMNANRLDGSYARYTKANFDLVMRKNQKFIDKYYSDYELNKDDLVW
jgi:hypothetical protein